MTPTDLETRLAAIEARAPGGHEPPALPTAAGARAGRRSRLFAPIAMAPVLVLAVAATAAAGGAVVANLVWGLPGAQNPGQPLEGANLECMSPPEAAAYLTERGFTNVVWQVETGSLHDKGTASSTQRATPPEHGYVVPGAFLGDGQLIMIVDQREGATGVGACYGDPMP